MADGHTYWDWRDALLRHPDGRAVGGEPCVKCGSPVQPNAHWKHRDRHVCSERCNANLSRQLNRSLKRGDEQRLPRPEAALDQRTDLTARYFGASAPGAPSGLDVNFLGFGPRHGDVVERQGIRTHYQWLPTGSLPAITGHAFSGLLVAVHASGHSLARVADIEGRATRVIHGEFAPSGEWRTTYSPFTIDGIDLIWQREIIRDIDPTGREYDWDATVCVPVSAKHPHTMWTAARLALSARRERVSTTTARHARRVRLEAATVERFDPADIYERDQWRCRLCGEAVDPVLAWPDPLSPSLDHIQPLAAHGEHSRANPARPLDMQRAEGLELGGCGSRRLNPRRHRPARLVDTNCPDDERMEPFTALRTRPRRSFGFTRRRLVDSSRR